MAKNKEREVEVSKLNDAVRQCDIAAVRRQAAKKHVAAFAKTIQTSSGPQSNKNAAANRYLQLPRKPPQIHPAV